MSRRATDRPARDPHEATHRRPEVSSDLASAPRHSVVEQGKQWSRHADEYEQVFLDPFRPGVVNPLLRELEVIEDAGALSVIDLGCGTGPLLPHLVGRFGEVTALDFAPGMIARARKRLGRRAKQVTFHTRPMHDLDDLAGRFDVAFAVNSIVMPDTRDIDRTLAAIRGCLKPGGRLVGVVPAIDAIHYATMLIMDRGLDEGLAPSKAEARAAELVEHEMFEFAFGRFRYEGLRQKFWQPFEVEHRLRKAGFEGIRLEKLLYPWDDDIAGGAAYAEHPPSWDWAFSAHR
jgi:SAM-dependent methyltransferase